MNPVEPIQTVDLFPPLSQELLSVLRTLSAAEWAMPTVCGPWTVKDVAAHLLGGSISRLWDDDSRILDDTSPVETYGSLLALINKNNDEWVAAARRISPRLLVEFLEMTDRQLYEHFRALDGDQSGVWVAWAGEDVSPNWFDIAREYTEKWLHQQHIREAVGKPLLASRQWLYPVLDTFLRGLPHAYRTVEADEGTSVCVRIMGKAGGDWSLRREGAAWRLYAGADPKAVSTVSITQDAAWRLFTKGVRREDIVGEVQITGDGVIGAQTLELVSIMA